MSSAGAKGRDNVARASPEASAGQQQSGSNVQGDGAPNPDNLLAWARFAARAKVAGRPKPSLPPLLRGDPSKFEQSASDFMEHQQAIGASRATPPPSHVSSADLMRSLPATGPLAQLRHAVARSQTWSQSNMQPQAQAPFGMPQAGSYNQAHPTNWLASQTRSMPPHEQQQQQQQQQRRPQMQAQTRSIQGSHVPAWLQEALANANSGRAPPPPPARLQQATPPPSLRAFDAALHGNSGRASSTVAHNPFQSSSEPSPFASSLQNADAPVRRESESSQGGLARATQPRTSRANAQQGSRLQSTHASHEASAGVSGAQPPLPQALASALASPQNRLLCQLLAGLDSNGAPVNAAGGHAASAAAQAVPVASRALTPPLEAAGLAGSADSRSFLEGLLAQSLAHTLAGQHKH